MVQLSVIEDYLGFKKVLLKWRNEQQGWKGEGLQVSCVVVISLTSEQHISITACIEVRPPVTIPCRMVNLTLLWIPYVANCEFLRPLCDSLHVCQDDQWPDHPELRQVPRRVWVLCSECRSNCIHCLVQMRNYVLVAVPTLSNILWSRKKSRSIVDLSTSFPGWPGLQADSSLQFCSVVLGLHQSLHLPWFTYIMRNTCVEKKRKSLETSERGCSSWVQGFRAEGEIVLVVC